jgi:hypothetical protein
VKVQLGLLNLDSDLRIEKRKGWVEVYVASTRLLLWVKFEGRRSGRDSTRLW